MEMKDYRTWWMRGLEVMQEMVTIYIPRLENHEYKDGDNYWCIKEQLWAIREGLACPEYIGHNRFCVICGQKRKVIQRSQDEILEP